MGIEPSPTAEEVRRYGRPCDGFVVPKDGMYGAYCERCGFSKAAHEWWDDTPLNDRTEA